MQLAEDKPF